jgi:hypothetical protein
MACAEVVAQAANDRIQDPIQDGCVSAASSESSIRVRVDVIEFGL